MVPAHHSGVLGRVETTLRESMVRRGRVVVAGLCEATFLPGVRGLPDRRKAREKQEWKDKQKHRINKTKSIR